MKIFKLMLASKDKAIIDFSQTLYQQKVGLLLYIAIVTRLNIAFAVFKLLKFN